MAVSASSFITKETASCGFAYKEPTPYKIDSPDICPVCKTKVEENGVELIGGHFHPQCVICSACNKLISDEDVIQKEEFIFHQNCFNEVYLERCAKCGGFVSSKIIIHALNKTYHPDCFCCAKCGNKEKVKQKYINVNEEPFCTACFDEVKRELPKCVVCKNTILAIDEKVTFFFNNKKCEVHKPCFGCFMCGSVPDIQDATIIYGKFACRKCRSKAMSRICAECNQLIYNDCATLEGVFWHKEHFKCCDCGTKLISNVAVLTEGVVRCRKCYDLLLRKCHGCGTADEGVDLTGCGYKWHSKCFKCMKCSCDLSSSQYVNMNGTPMCKDCYKNLNSKGKIDKWRRVLE